MRKHITLLLLLLCLGWEASAQVDSIIQDIQQHLTQIALCRHEVKASFLQQDTQSGQFWMDSLQRLDDTVFAATIWDERWMLYYWLGDYSHLLQDVRTHTRTKREEESYRYSMADDSIFNLLDPWLYDHREQVMEKIDREVTSGEERAFLRLHLEYLLRMNTENDAKQLQDKRIRAFANIYSNSKYLPFLRAFVYDGTMLGNHAIDLDIGMMQGNWTDELERTLNPLVGLQVGLAYWTHRVNLQANFNYGRTRLDRPVFVGTNEWPKDDKASYFDISFELGYDLVDKDRIRIFPSVGMGGSFLHPPDPEEGADPLPVYYSDFYFNQISYTAAITTDLKFRSEYDQSPEKQFNYYGIRLKAGYRNLNFGKKNDSLAGNMVFFAASFNIYSRQSTKKRL